jgi:DnaJ homolog subfamily C member 9
VWNKLGSSDEIDDLKNTYTQAGGDIGEIMNHIPHSTHEDEPRFINLLTGLISSGELPQLPAWEAGVHDEKARLVRQKQGAKEAKEAEELAKELGVWDEFYGSGKPRAKKGKKGHGKGKRKQGDDAEGDEEDHSALQALMLKRKKNMDGFFDNLAAKYAEPEPSSRGKNARGKRRAQDDGEDGGEPPKKKAKSAVHPPDIDDEEFAKLQAKLFDKERKPPSKSKGSRSKRAKS